MCINNGAVSHLLLEDFASKSSPECYEEERHFAVFSVSQSKVMKIIKYLHLHADGSH
jgi:hypothetical protein